MAEFEPPRSEAVTLDKVGPITTVRMHADRSTQPPFSVTSDIWIGLEAAFKEASIDPETRVVILRGERRFGSGANFHELLKIYEQDKANESHRAAQAFWRLMDYAHTAIEDCPKPVVAVIDRYALGAAFALSMACDFRIAAADSQLGIPAADKGLTLGLKDTDRLVAKVGGAVAGELLMLGGTYSAQEALRMGFVNMVASPDELDEKVSEVVGRLARNAPLAMKEAKANIAMAIHNPGLAGVNEASWPIAWAHSSDLHEGITAFLEKREPTFEGK